MDLKFHETHPIKEMREMAQGLSDLRTATAPHALLPAVLVRVGLGDAYWRMETPIGPIFVAAGNEGVSAVMPAGDETAFEQTFRARFGRPAYPVAVPPPALARTITGRLDGSARSPLRFDLRGLSEFEQAVLRKALEIPHGEVRPYGWISREIGRPGAVRAVGTALGHNPVPLLIPCHRVVRSDGKIGDYALGPDAKRAMLAAEGTPPAEIERRARAGVRFHGSDTTKIFCFPTCRHARRTTARHLVSFPSETAARAAGYRPCLVCRPALAS